MFGSTNAEGSAKTTPLLLALRWRYERVARLLVSKGAQVNLADTSGTTPLMEAVRGEPPVSLGTLDFLIAHGAYINDRDNNGSTALEEAAENHDVRAASIIDYLVRHGANVNDGSQGDSAALMTAVENLNDAAVRVLIRYHADVNTSAEDGTALYHAYHNIDNFVGDKKLTAAHDTIIALLKKAGAKE